LGFILFVIFLVSFLWLVPQIGFLRRSGLPKLWLQLIFLIKAGFGILYGWMSLNYFNASDTWSVFRKSLPETKLLRIAPGAFFEGILHNNYSHGFTRFLSSRDSWWNDLHNTVFIKMIAVLNLLTSSSYYTNVLFFAFLSTLGSIALYRIFARYYPGRPLALIAGCVLPPSFLLWTSGITRDCLVAFSLYLTFYVVWKIISDGLRLRYAVTLLFGLSLLLIFRNYMFILVIACLLPWRVAMRRKRPLITFACFFAAYAVIFFQVSHVFPSVNPPKILVEKQEDFYTLIGQSRIETPKLKPTFQSFAGHSVHALSLSLFRPGPGDMKGFFTALSFFEILFCWLLFMCWLVGYKGPWRLNPLLAFCIMFSLAELLIIGFTVNFLGAIVRYRGILLPLLMAPLLATIRWPKKENRNILE
jgi:hypothetical protein